MAWSAKSYLLAEVVPRFAPGHSYRGHVWVLGAISWHRYSGTATHEGDERASTTEKRARATHDKGALETRWRYQ